jgi:hypothetical protein
MTKEYKVNKEIFERVASLPQGEILAMAFAHEKVFSHIKNQIKTSKEDRDVYRRREMVRLQIAKGYIGKALRAGRRYSKSKNK